MNELLVIFLIILLLFGASRIPEVAKAMGKGIRDFKKATREIEEDLSLKEDPPEAERTTAERTSTKKDTAASNEKDSAAN